MPSRVRRVTIYRCPLERAFRAPMLGELTHVHTGFGLMPRVTHCTEDTGWAAIGSSKKVFMAQNLGFGGGYASMDRVLERVENQRWAIEVSDFHGWMLGFTRFVGEWETREVAPGEVEVRYTYTLYGDSPWFAPARWLFAHTFWRLYMGRVLDNVRKIAYNDGPYGYV